MNKIFIFGRFTSVLRSTIKFQGFERLAVAGGEELWVFLNHVMLLQLLHDPSDDDIPCKSIHLNTTTNSTESCFYFVYTHSRFFYI